MLEKVKGIVIKTQDYGETHKIVTLFGEHSGKITAIARGANKPRSKMTALTQPFIYAENLIYLNARGLSTLQQGDVIDSFRGIREDIIKTAYAAYIAELTDKIMERHEVDHFLFKQLYLTLKRISEGDEPAVLVMMYELKLYRKEGFAPVLDQCAVCGRSEMPYAFSINEGGFLCPRCKQMDPYAVTLSEALAKWLLVFMQTDLERIGKISVKEDNIKRLRSLLDAYYEQYGGYYLKSKRFLKQIDLLQ